MGSRDYVRHDLAGMVIYYENEQLFSHVFCRTLKLVFRIRRAAGQSLYLLCSTHLLPLV